MSVRDCPAQVEMRPLRVTIQHGVDLKDRRPCLLANIHCLNVLILREVQPCRSCRKKTRNNQMFKKTGSQVSHGGISYIVITANEALILLLRCCLIEDGKKNPAVITHLSFWIFNCGHNAH